VVAFGLAVSAGIARPLIRLTRSADNVARAAEAELARVADDEAETNEPLRLEAVNVAARAEVGELARAFERIQVTAARLVERQVTSRRNVAQMFGHIGRRTQNMVGRQLDLIDLLEYEETDPERLRELYRLDHLASRLRRNASSLVVLSGMVDTSRYRAPISLAEVVRHALGEIEDYARVDIDVPELLVSPAIIGDLILMCAELMENATRFSPPHSRVTVTAGTVPAGAQVSIVDRGIGLSETRLADENARLARRERLDLVPTEVLGLFVVGRLARRHRVTVNLSHTHGGGITAALTLPNSVLVSGDIGATDPVAATTAPARRNALPTRIPAVDVGALQRLNEALDTGMTWNAFDPSAPVPSTRPPDAVPLPRQRVPGAQLPVASPAAVTTGAPSASDASAVRDLVGAFEGGVRRAQEQVRRPSGLTRRVPGATVGALATGPSPPAGTPQLDPLQALSRIKQIEQGVARALEEIRSDRERDEEPRR
jgi:HAMP domain-containing protein